MPFDMFLKIEGIDGESVDAKHKNEIDVFSFSWGVTQSAPGGGAGGGGGAGKAAFQDLSFVQRVNKASPQLFLSCASGKHIKSALLTVRKAGGSQIEYLKIKLSDILVSSFQTGGSGGEDLPLEQVSLGYAKIEFQYTPQKADGSAGNSVKSGWNLDANKKI